MGGLKFEFHKLGCQDQENSKMELNVCVFVCMCVWLNGKKKEWMNEEWIKWMVLQKFMSFVKTGAQKKHTRVSLLHVFSRGNES